MNEDEVVCKFKEFTALVERQTGRKLKTLRSDNGKEYVCAEMKFMREKGIKRQLTVQYTPEQNGIAERCNRTLYKSKKYAGGCKTRKEVLGRSREHNSTFEKCFSDESCQGYDT